jgi:hypothetical protein
MNTATNKAPTAMAERFAAITELTAAFCRERLNEYAQMSYARAALCR